jgi:hypothetical protein
MTEKRTMGLNGCRSSNAGQNEDENEVHRGVGEISAVDVTGSNGEVEGKNHNELFMLRRILRELKIVV